MSTELLEKAKAQSWYHTLDLPGLQTSGLFDMRPYVGTYGLPGSLAGMRVLEIGTWDGFWAFEMERRGAEEVVALDLDDERDLDWPPRRRDFNPEAVRGEGFRVAAELLESKVERVVCSVYDARSADLGQFDLILCGSVLIHLRDQLLALERIAGLVKPGGTFISAEGYDRLAGLLPWPAARFRGNRTGSVVFWEPSRRAWRDMLWYAGFQTVREQARFTMQSTAGWKIRHVVHHASR
jgi:tRNA (mo5U34)-methyltransferase